MVFKKMIDKIRDTFLLYSFRNKTSGAMYAGVSNVAFG